MACQSCESERVISVGGKASDMHFVAAPHLDYEHDGYLPSIPNIGGGDYTEFDVCLECGQVQGEWPVSDACLTDEE